MISIYNKAIVKELNPQLLEELEKIEKQGLKKVKVFPSKSGENTIMYQENGKEYCLHSRYQPSYEARKLIESYNISKDVGNVVFFGVGLGYHIKETLDQLPEIKYFLVEPDLEILYCFLEQNELKDWQIRNLGGIENNYERMQNTLPEFFKKFENTSCTIALKSYIFYFPEKYKEFLKKYALGFKKEIDNRVSFVVLEHRRVRSAIKNMKTILEVPNLFWIDKQQFHGKTAIIVAAGPSLEMEIENLRQIKRDKMAGIFAVGSAVNALISYGIHPDAVFSYDPTEANQKVLQKIKTEGISDIPLFFGSDIGYESLENYPGEIRSIIIHNSEIASHYLEVKEEPLPIAFAGATISVLALTSLITLGFSTITFVGQNLAMKGSQSYTSGIDYINTAKEDLNQYSEFVKDVHGNEVRTASVYLIMKDTLEQAIKAFGQDVQIFNSTTGGAAIEGTRFMALEDLMKTLPINGFNMDLTAAPFNYDIARIEEKVKKMGMERDVVERYITSYENIIEEIKQKMKLKQYHQLQKSYVKLNLALKRLETNLFSYMFVLPMVKLLYDELVSKIDYFNEIQDPQEQAEMISIVFDEFMKAYKGEFNEIKELYNCLEEPLKEYVADRKQGKLCN